MSFSTFSERALSFSSRSARSCRDGARRMDVSEAAHCVSSHWEECRRLSRDGIDELDRRVDATMRAMMKPQMNGDFEGRERSIGLFGSYRHDVRVNKIAAMLILIFY